MEIRVLGSTKLGYEMNRDEILEFAGKEANICYTTRSVDAIFTEDSETSVKRGIRTLKSGHHSVSDHLRFNFGISGIPKILAMVLNNEGFYSASEKSARYTQMKLTPREQEKYDKWLSIFSNEIEKNYGDKFLEYNQKMGTKKDPKDVTKDQILKLAQENARYLISVFTPTILGYSVDVRQLKYIYEWMGRFIEESDNTPFNTSLKYEMDEFREAIREYITIDEIQEVKGRRLSLFDTRRFRYESFGEVYSINYKGTFAQLAQAQRHRTLRYKMAFLPKNEFYIPRLIENDEKLKAEWLEDITSLADLFPQGMLIMINERGTYEDFIQKCSERLCGHAQLEIAIQTQETAKRYVSAVKDKYPEIYEILLPYATKARCQIAFKCDKPCVWGGKDAFTRLC